MNKFKLQWSNLQSSFWFVPSLIVAASIALAATLIGVDSAKLDTWLTHWPRMFGAAPESARGMLSTIAASMMSVVAVTFSMTLVALALASSQYTSRILRNFMHSRVTQVSLGSFAGIFAYCLVVLRTIRDGPDGEFVPGLAVFAGFLLALAGVGVLILFIHNIASSIQASSIIASVARETILAVDRLFPEALGPEPEEAAESAPETGAGRGWYAVRAARSGYLQSVNDTALLQVAQECRTVVRMEHGIGAFVVQDTALASLALEGPPDDAVIAKLNGAFSISRYRTVEQDPAFGIRQMVDVALKALSPGVNDTSTAGMSVDYLTAVMARLATRKLPLSHRYEAGKLRVMAKTPTFSGLLAEAFDQIRRCAAGNVAMMLGMLDAHQTIASLTTSPTRRRAIREQVLLIAELAERTIEPAQDRAKVERRLVRVLAALDNHPTPGCRQGEKLHS